ncbi:MAG TPA: BTAD domain-containing putative transcriptional regulator [Streptosporangiaceae bacterium]|nr:BTAD domain-containing putative transcriptional regulator [Streptosporangiaceae bacterium]
MKSLAVRVLGDFGVDGIEPQALGSRKARLALQLIALGAGQAVPAAVLIDALWDTVPPARPEDQLAVLMSRLRTVLGRDRIEHRDQGYLLHCDWLDATELAVLAREMQARREAGHVMGAVAAARVALSLIRGDGPQPLPGEWAQLRQAELSRLTGRARLVAAAALLEAGDWMAAADAAAAAAERDPYDEAALRLLLRAHLMGGRVAGALSLYASARERMADELGTDPSPETTALYTAILRGELTGPGPAASGPAGPLLVGRDDELAYLEAVAARAREAIEVVVVDGEAGIGKTTLLRAWAGRRIAAGDTVLIASCGPLDRSMPLDALLTALAGLLRGLGPDTAADVLGADAALLGPLLSLAPGPRLPPMLADSMLGPAVLYSALVRALGRLAERAPLVVVVDDAHLAGPALPDWLRFAVREKLAVTVVAAVRSGEGEPLPASAFVHLGALGREAAAELVGPGRVDELYTRSRGHPLFLTELAQQAAGSELPASLVESVSARCDELGPAGLLLRTAAVIGPDLDVDLLAAVLGRPAVALLGDAEQAVAKQFLVEADGMFRFRHELVREALAASATAGRAALLHRQAGRVLDRRPGVDPLTVAGHARLGGDLALASRALRDASARAAERHDYAAAEALLDDALRLDAGPDGWLARAGSAPCADATPRHWRTWSGPARLARRRSRSARGRPTSAVTSPRPPSSPRTARSPRTTRRPGRGAWRPAAGPTTRRATWPGPSCCSARRSHSPRGRTGWPPPGGSGYCGRIRAGRRRRWRCCARRRAGRSGWSTRRPRCTRCCSPGTRTRWPAGRPRRWPRWPGTPPRWNGGRSRASPGAG